MQNTHDCVIVNHAHQFLLSDKRSWGKTDQDVLVTTRREALALARGLVIQAAATRYIVTDYGHEAEEWWAVSGTDTSMTPLEAPPPLVLDGSGIL